MALKPSEPPLTDLEHQVDDDSALPHMAANERLPHAIALSSRSINSSFSYPQPPASTAITLANHVEKKASSSSSHLPALSMPTEDLLVPVDESTPKSSPLESSASSPSDLMWSSLSNSWAEDEEGRSSSSESGDSAISAGKKSKLSSFDSLAGSSGKSRRPSPHSSGPLQTQLHVEEMASSGLWVFGYGSLVWHQGFDFSESLTGYVVGFSRRFWQGNVTHRGTENQPGRVATLIEDSEGIVWGQAFRVCGEAALPYLDNRECQLGGYRTSLTTFHPRCGSPPFPVLLYLATPNNKHWLGEDPLPEIADQIVSSNGPSGHNVEYLLRLAEFIRDKVPDAKDDHLFDLEHLVRKRVNDKGLCLKTLMGQVPAKEAAGDNAGEAAVPAAAAAAPPPSPPQFSNRVPTKKLRCVNI